MATALTTAEIVDIACQIAKVPGYTSQALKLLNGVLQELSQDYDFLTIRQSCNFNLSTTASGNGYAVGSGPNPMPSNFLRLHRNALVNPSQMRMLEKQYTDEEGECWAMRLHSVPEMLQVSRRQLSAVRSVLQGTRRPEHQQTEPA